MKQLHKKDNEVIPVSNQDLVAVLLEFQNYGIILMDDATQIVTWNLGAEHLYNYTSQEATGRPISFLYSNSDMLHQELYLEKAAEEKRVEYDSVETKKDGTIFYANTILVAIHHSDGSINGFAKLMRDITPVKMLADENAVLKQHLEDKVRQRTNELEVVNKELEAFSYSVSHDLRTPLRAVIGYSMMLKEDYEEKLDAEAKRIINNIVQNTKMMGQLIDDLLTFSKMARLTVVHISIDMKRMAENCLNEILQIEKTPGISINIHDLPYCNGDPSMLRQVWYNLLHNAIKYSARVSLPIIEIGVLERATEHVYYVKDNGEGFDMKYADKLFGVFQRLHRQDEFEGTGLGLALVKRIISKHGGNIWPEASLKKGATFYFSIPKHNYEE